MEDATLKVGLWNKSVPRVELDHQARQSGGDRGCVGSPQKLDGNVTDFTLLAKLTGLPC